MEINHRKWLAPVLVTALSILGLGAVAQPAYATSDLINTHYHSGVAGDAIYLDKNENCPGNESTVSTVKAVFIDSSNTVHREHLSDTIPYAGGNMWIQAVWHVPEDASLGAGTLKAECWSDGVVTKEYEMPTAFTVVAPTTGLGVNDAYIGDNLHIQSFTPCPAGTFYPIYSVSIFIRSVSTTTYAWGSQFVTDKFDSIWPLSGSSNWAIDIELDRNNFIAGETYSLRAQCGYSGGQQTVYYDSLLFTVQPNTYIAMGDSYSSGEGSFNYNLPGGNCHRSTDSYPHYLVDDVPLDPPYFAACSGAMTDDLFSPNPVNTDEKAQTANLDAGVETVTLTIGGNDIGFQPVLEACADYIGHTGFDCANNTAMTSEVMDRIGKLAGYGTTTAPGGRTIHSYTDILTEITTKAPNATVYIAGYPELFGEDPTYWDSDMGAPGSFKCAVYDGTVTHVYVAYNDAMWMNDRVRDLNAAIEDAVDAFNSPNVVYVPTSTFDSHGLCDSGTPYVNGVIRGGSTGSPQSESFHPNTTGMSSGYGVAFADAID